MASRLRGSQPMTADFLSPGIPNLPASETSRVAGNKLLVTVNLLDWCEWNLPESELLGSCDVLHGSSSVLRGTPDSA